MQLKLSAVVCSVLMASALQAEDYISVQYMSYDEESGRTTIDAPSIELSKDFGPDYTLNIKYVHDAVSGASPTYYDAASGASATIPQGTLYRADIHYGAIAYEDDRTSISAALTTRFASRDELTVGYSYSDENDYTSKELSAEYLHYLDSSKNSAVSLGASYQRNTAEIYCFMGTSVCDGVSGASSKSVAKDIDVTSVELGYTQVIDKTSLAKASLFAIHEEGFLTNPYMRVVRDYATSPRITEEKKPDTRNAVGITLEYTKSLSDALSAIASYRYYHDDWDITSHTLDIKLHYEMTEDLTLGVGFRAYTQSAAEFFSGKRDYFTTEAHASSDRRVSDFDALNYTITLDYKLSEKSSINASAGYYSQPDYFDASYINVGFKYTF